MTIIINEKEITLKYTFRAMMIYEKITDESFSFNGLSELIILFYSTLLASDKDCTMTFEEFIDWCDENPTEINNFTEWVTRNITKNNHIKGDVEKGDVEPKKG